MSSIAVLVEDHRMQIHPAGLGAGEVAVRTGLVTISASTPQPPLTHARHPTSTRAPSTTCTFWAVIVTASLTRSNWLALPPESEF
ncbi:MAG TPA: hypothetical protein VGD55_04250 [Acidothermaceae bacterium]